MRNFTDEQIVALQAQLIVVMHERDGYKAELGRIAAAVYPHKEVPFTYSVDFVIDEIERARVREAELQALIGANSEELKSARTAIYRHTELAARVKALEGVIAASDRINNEVCERVGIPPFGCDTADHLADELEGLRQRIKTLEDALEDITVGWSAVVSRGIANHALAAKEPKA